MYFIFQEQKEISYNIFQAFVNAEIKLDFQGSQYAQKLLQWKLEEMPLFVTVGTRIFFPREVSREVIGQTGLIIFT